jgi:hypothetical protein
LYFLASPPLPTGGRIKRAEFLIAHRQNFLRRDQNGGPAKTSPPNRRPLLEPRYFTKNWGCAVHGSIRRLRHFDSRRFGVEAGGREATMVHGTRRRNGARGLISTITFRTMKTKQDASAAATTTAKLSQSLDAASLPFVGRWNKLVTTTNWEKGRIIHQWREAMTASGAPVTDYSDEAWARRVTGVTGQHVGRLRRVFQKFGDVYQDFDGLYWSHFQAALDWEDHQAWLRQAAEQNLSVTQMRQARWDALGVSAEERAAEDEPVAAELDEDFEPALRESPSSESSAARREQARTAADGPSIEGPTIEGPDFGDEDGGEQPPRSEFHDGFADEENAPPAVRPFQAIGALPDDVVEAFEGYKLAILRHKREGWREITLDEMLATLDSLKELALAPLPAAVAP